MKKSILFGFLCFVFLMAYGYGEQTRPVAVSPGSDSGLVIVGQSCPTFSWSAVQWSQGYKVAIFPAVGAEVLTYEEIELLVSPIVSKEIRGPALSWTPSEAERLASGEAYVWYVQAVDASGLGVWSEGRMFQVDETVRILGVKEKLRESLKEYGMSDEDIERVLTEATSDLQAVEVKESSEMAPAYSGIDQGTEGATVTYYGLDAGHSATGSSNSFFGHSAGYASSGSNNTFLGHAAGNKNTTGYDNTFVGYYSGYLNQWGFRNTSVGYAAGINANGNSNTAIGYAAGHDNSDGDRNNFLGVAAGYANTSGNDNSFLGYGAGRLNTTGSRNTLIGNYSGYSNTASYNTFLGYYSGYNNTSGFYNTFLGYYAGYSNTSADYNTFVGYRAGYNNTDNQNTNIGYQSGYYNDGSYNTFLGYYAGRMDSTANTASYNTGVGERVGYGLTEGDYNTFLGSYTGYNLTTGSRNTFIGRVAGNGITTGSDNVCLGYGAGPTYNCSDYLYINNEQSNTPLIFGNFSTPLLIFYHDSDTWVRIYPNGANAASHVIDVYDGGYGAYCNGTQWVDSSSREVKENIQSLDPEEAIDAFQSLDPVKFNYKNNKEDECLGFIAEDVPDLVASQDRKGMSAMDVVAVLTKVVQEQQAILKEHQKVAQKQQDTINELCKQIDDLKKRK